MCDRYVYYNQACAQHDATIDHTDFPEAFPGDIKCLVVVINRASRKALFDEFMQVGRVVANPLRLEMQFTTARSEDPLLNATAVTCSVSRVVAENYRRDYKLQEEQDEYVALEDQILRQVKLVDFYQDTVASLAAFMPPSPPPPPPPPPPSPAQPFGVVLPGSPAPPMSIAWQKRIDNLKAELLQMESRRDQLIDTITGCVPSRTNFCGRSSVQAPNPWVVSAGRVKPPGQTRADRQRPLAGRGRPPLPRLLHRRDARARRLRILGFHSKSMYSNACLARFSHKVLPS